MIAAIYARKSIERRSVAASVRARVVVGCFGLLGSGCASFQSTPAQDRVWAAYEVCRQLPGAGGAMLDRVTPDGRWWWWTSNSMAAGNVLNLCMQRELSRMP